MLISFLHTDMSVTKFNDNPDFVKITIFSQIKKHPPKGELVNLK